MILIMSLRVSDIPGEPVFSGRRNILFLKVEHSTCNSMYVIITDT